MNLFLIKRGPQPDYHKAPFHPIILCDRKKIAKWQAGATDGLAWVWEQGSGASPAYGWLLSRWQGLDIDYGHIVRHMPLPDGTQTAFWRAYDHPTEASVCPLLCGAVWWSDRPIPEWLVKLGVRYPEDVFSQHTILDNIKEEYDWAALPADEKTLAKRAPWVAKHFVMRGDRLMWRSPQEEAAAE